jgi:Zn-dependent protease with chaperone function
VILSPCPLLTNRLSGVIAVNLRLEITQAVNAHTIEMLGENYFEPSALSAQKQQEISARFASLKQNTEISHASLLFRGGERIGANAFVQPGGEVVVTDKPVGLAESQDEIAAVLLHELAHIKHRHSLRKMVESASLYIFISLWLGDAEAMESFSVLLFYVLLDTKYSRDYEREADAFVLEYAQKYSKSIASGFLNIMERIEASEPALFKIKPENRAEPKEKSEELEKDTDRDSLFDYLSTHPITQERLESFRQFINEGG